MSDGRRKTPPVSVMRRDLTRNSLRPNSYFAYKWGVSRERVRQIRSRLGFPASSIVQEAVRREAKATKAAERAKMEATLSDRTCPVCGKPVPVLRDTTCSSPCAMAYRNNSRYRHKRAIHDRQPDRARS